MIIYTRIIDYWRYEWNEGDGKDFWFESFLDGILEFYSI